MKLKEKSKFESTNFLYNYRTDLAEINRYNYRLLIHDYFRLTTKKITLMAMMLAINFVLTLFSRYVLGLIPVSGFFVIEISFVSVLMFSLINNFFYTFIFLEITVWFRLILGSEPIGLLAMNLIDGFFLIILCLVVFSFKRLAIKFQVTNWINKFFIFQLIIFFLITLLTSGMAILINYSFLLPLYFPEGNKNQIIFTLPIIFGLNIAKYLLNGFLYFLTFKPLINLACQYQI